MYLQLLVWKPSGQTAIVVITYFALRRRMEKGGFERSAPPITPRRLCGPIPMVIKKLFFLSPVSLVILSAAAHCAHLKEVRLPATASLRPAIQRNWQLGTMASGPRSHRTEIGEILSWPRVLWSYQVLHLGAVEKSCSFTLGGTRKGHQGQATPT